MKVWILGAGGQVGRALVDFCQAENIRFVAATHAEADITNLEQLQRAADKIAPTHILNAAAFTDVDGAETQFERAHAVNALGPEHIGIVAAERDIHVVHLSTDYVFDGLKETPYVEEDPTSPLGVYGKTKREGEERLFEQLPTACIIRTSWVFGILGKNFISYALSILQNKERIEAVDDQQNRPTYNRDLARAMLDLSSHSGLFHFANHGVVSRYQIVLDFQAEAHKRGIPIRCKEIVPVLSTAFPAKSPRPLRSILSTAKIERVLGRKPRLWETVLGEYLNHVKASV